MTIMKGIFQTKQFFIGTTFCYFLHKNCFDDRIPRKMLKFTECFRKHENRYINCYLNTFVKNEVPNGIRKLSSQYSKVIFKMQFTQQLLLKISYLYYCEYSIRKR